MSVLSTGRAPAPAGPGREGVSSLIDPRGDGPIRAELYGVEHLESLARGLAGCRLAPPAREGSPLLRRFAENGAALAKAHRDILAGFDRAEGRGLDAEWLVDNYHAVDDVLTEVRKDLPHGYDAELPKLAEEPLVGYPRVYALALALVAHTDGGLDEPRISGFVDAFQSAAALTIGELWAFPTMLRLVLLENLRRLAEQMLEGRAGRRRADAWAAGHLEATPEGIVADGQPVLDGPPPFGELAGSFVVRLIEILRDQGPGAAPALERLEAELKRHGIDPDGLLREEHRRQAANQISVGNAVTSLRLLAALDWHAFFERASRVESVLRDDPAGIYEHQDFATRDRMRRAVEKLARGAGVDEAEVAGRAVGLARASHDAREGPARGHVGYYLIDRGRGALQAGIGYRPEGPERLLRLVHDRPRLVYFGSIGLATAGLVALPSLVGIAAGAGPWLMLLLVLALVVPASEVAVGLVHLVLTMFLPPRTLPKLDFRGGISDEFPTFVVMPSMLARPDSAANLVERLEIHFLANPDPMLRFALLTDFADAHEEHRPEDDGYVRAALDGIKELNDRHAAGGPDKFFLFHRRRQYNPVQGVWMGWERKRGKLSEFNRLIRGAADTSYAVLSGDLTRVPRTRFVITLDADTMLIRDTARRLVGTLAHPLNAPRFDPARGRVVEGFGVLQPRVSVHMAGASRSRFTNILASSAGIDPYSVAVSDVYMDLFHSGSFTGKGIYDLDAFEEATGRTFPEDQILSHDLIEGNYARCGLVTDIELFDDFPARYHAYARREHRWVRGDWQLLPWLGRTVPSADGPRRNPLPMPERWKVFDNLRRSLVPPSVVVLLVLGWTVLPGPAWLWTLAALAVPGLPVIQQMLGAIIGAIRSGSLGPIRGLKDGIPATAAQALLTISFLADQARLLVDATLRTLYRLFISRRNLLEWETAAAAERRLGQGPSQFVKTMWPAQALALAIVGLVAWAEPASLPVAGPVLLAWFASPALAYWVSRPRPPKEAPLNAAERAALRRVARRTWRFFEAFVGAEDHWLPPDNFQEEGGDRVAHRTSPTNQGLVLISTLVAHDLGYIGLRPLADRLEGAFDALEKLDRHKGHLFNWYRTTTLEALPPAYISTVDSGNLLGCLFALREGLAEVLDGPIVGPDLAAGLADALGLAREPIEGPRAPKLYAPLEADLGAILARLDERPETLGAWDTWLGALEWAAAGALGRFKSLAEGDPSPPAGVESWLRAFEAEVRERRAELAALDADPSAAPPTLAALGLSSPVAAGLAERLRAVSDRAEAMAAAMDFTFLYKDDRHLYSIGFNLAQDRLDASCYDLLASESCLTSYLTVARGEVPRRHWFQLGRPYIHAAGRIGLLSWGGTMFEYLMPRLLLRPLPGSLLAETHRATVARQVEFGRETGVPWGISESGFSAQYADGDYQYQSFGVPGLGLKRGLARDLVVAPYATALAAMIEPREALANFRRLEAEGGLGAYGFYEAIDYTPDRLPRGKKSVVVRSYMAHHQGMSLVALANAAMDDLMPRRFHASPTVRSGELLLQERVPRDVPIVDPTEGDELADPADPAEKAGRPKSPPPISRRINTPATAAPRTHLLCGGGEYTVMVTNAGSGYSRCRGLDLTRWREDPTRDASGQFIYVRDLASGSVWSAGYQPTRRAPDEYEVVFSTDKANFRRRDEGIETRLEVTVSPEGPVEVRRVTLTNLGANARDLDVTSYAEAVLGPRGADLAHPAFGKLFLETEWLDAPGALLCRRRPRSDDERPSWALHVSAADNLSGPPEAETDRARFLGRGRTPAAPAALDPGASLSGTVGAVLDPILSLRRRVRLEPGASAVVAFTTAVASDRDDALVLAGQYRELGAASRAFDLAWAHSQVEHRHRHWSPEEVVLYQRLAAHLIYAGATLRSAPEVIAANKLGQPGLWALGVSGDNPIALVRVVEPEEMPLVRQVLDAHAYLRHKGLAFDLILLDDRPSSYNDPLHTELLELVRASHAGDMMDRPGGVFVRDRDGVGPEGATLLQAAARAVLVGARGPMAAQLDRVDRPRSLPTALAGSGPRPDAADAGVAAPADLLFANGLGGFTTDGREYVILVRPGDAGSNRNGRPRPGALPRPALPPAPWINVVANPAAGFVVSEAGSGTTWAGNSQSNRLTPWNNDPVSDPPGEAIYVRDEETGDVWSPTPLPVADPSPVLVRHGQGYTSFERRSHGLDHRLTLCVPTEDPVKVVRLALTNPGTSARKVSATFYAEWVLGTTREANAPWIVTEVDAETGALLARNPYNTDFAGHVAFADVGRRPRTLTGDRAEFLGRNGSLNAPAALGRVELSGRVGAGLDPCAAIQATLEIEPGGTAEVVFLLGQGRDLDEARSLIARHREPAGAAKALEDATRRWDAILGAVVVKTPDPGLDLMVNRWLPYQALSCRVWGRSALYQSGGAYGFRDQLQDAMALVYGAPDEAREQLLRSAARQFPQGDVQHWWHPPSGKGVRTRISDDYLWLPYVAARYVATAGDPGVLGETIPFLDGPELRPDQDEDYGQPTASVGSATLYEHCALALERGIGRLGAHGLPLMGTGDWNDGMNRVGSGGKGESVWLAWFLLAALKEFTPLADARGDSARSARFRSAADSLRSAVEATAWDGDWYLRAFFDDGTPLGSSKDDECRIDSIAQSWAVISGAAEPARADSAMAAAETMLVKDADGLVLLFTPPFDADGGLHPGYIKGYVPGIRENGGQYTHAATWVVKAEAMRGRGARALELFNLLSPVRHADDPASVEKYKVEPYVVAADIYGMPPHTGRGGWTWYTGSAAWLFRVALEDILGLRLSGDRMAVDPRIPPGWPGFELTYRRRSATYRIVVENPHGAERGVATVTLDGQALDGHDIPLADDGREHAVRVVMGPPG